MDEERTYLTTTIYIREGFAYKRMSELMSELEQLRMKLILEYLETHSSINSALAAGILKVQTKTATRLLAKAEKIGALGSNGKTRSKIYTFHFLFCCVFYRRSFFDKGLLSRIYILLH